MLCMMRTQTICSTSDNVLYVTYPRRQPEPEAAARLRDGDARRRVDSRFIT